MQMYKTRKNTPLYITIVTINYNEKYSKNLNSS